MKKKTVLVGLLFIMLAFLFAIHSYFWRSFRKVPLAPSPGGIQKLRISLSNEPDTLDPHRTVDMVALLLIRNTGEGLIELDRDFTPQPALAKTWEMSPDMKTYTFYLREDTRWSDGVPLQAHHFVDAWKRALSLSTTSASANLLYAIKNARRFNQGELPWEAVGVEAPDPHLLRVTLEYPSASFLFALNHPVSFPLRMEIVATAGERWFEAEQMPVIGPYRIASWQHDYKIILERNRQYWGRTPAIWNIEVFIIQENATALALFESGGLDIAPLPYTDWKRFRRSPLLHESLNYATTFVVFNTEMPPFDQPRVRKAFAMAINQAEIEKITQGRGIPIYSIFPLQLPGYSSSLRIGFNPARAREWLDTLLPGDRGPYLLGSNSGLDYKTVLEWLQQEWEKALKVKISLEFSEWKIYFQRLSVGNPYHLYRFGWQASLADPLEFLELFASNNPNNFSGWKNAHFDKLLETIARTIPGEKRNRMIISAEDVLIRDQSVVVPLYNLTRHRLIQPWVKGYWANGVGPCPFKALSLRKD